MSPNFLALRSAGEDNPSGLSLTSAVIQRELKTAGNLYSKSFILQVTDTCKAS